MTTDLRGQAAALLEKRLRTGLDGTSGVEDRLHAQLAQMFATAGAAPKLQCANALINGRFTLQSLGGLSSPSGGSCKSGLASPRSCSFRCPPGKFAL